MPTTRVRGVRVPDERWKRAQETADSEGTDISKVINEFLENYGRPKFVGQRTEPYRAAMREIVAPPKRRNKQKQPMAIPVNKETCKHLVIKRLPVGTWCRDCGSKMPADAQSKV